MVISQRPGICHSLHGCGSAISRLSAADLSRLLQHLHMRLPILVGIRSEGRASGLSGGQCRLGALADKANFMLGDGSEDVDGKPIGFGEVGDRELDIRFHQVADERDAGIQSVEFGDE
jgi:hypothetical protein